MQLIGNNIEQILYIVHPYSCETKKWKLLNKAKNYESWFKNQSLPFVTFVVKPSFKTKQGFLETKSREIKVKTKTHKVSL